MAADFRKALCGLLLLAASPARAECFPEVDFAESIFLVVPESKTSVHARLTVLERERSSGRWLPSTGERRSIIGRNGMAWAPSFQYFARPGDRIKTEGDGRTPGGLFAVGAPFGFGPSRLNGYVRLDVALPFCIDDPRSPNYNGLISRAAVPAGTSGEDMAKIPLYRRGLFVDYPTDKVRAAGSCIFIHVWRSDHGSTQGCIALSEEDVADLQKRALKGKTILAVLPEKEAEALRACIDSR